METWCRWENARKGSSCGFDRIHSSDGAGNIAELAASVFVALLAVLLSVRTIGYKGEQCSGGESVSQSPLMCKLFSFQQVRTYGPCYQPLVHPVRPLRPQAS